MEFNLTSKLMSCLTAVRSELKVSKGQYNKFGGYAYRSLEDITLALNPICQKHRCGYSLSDTIEQQGDRFYVVAHAMFYCEDDPEAYLIVAGEARECEAKKGMDDAQLTGSCSSYARKYALCGLFGIDSGEDPDKMDNRPAKGKTTSEKASRKASAAKSEAEHAAVKQFTPVTPETASVLDDAAVAFADIAGKTKTDVFNAVRKSRSVVEAGYTGGDMSEEQAKAALNVVRGWISRKKE